MLDEVTIVSRASKCYIELIHRAEAPGLWIVRRSRKYLVFKREFSSHSFTSRQKAFLFANRMMKDYETFFGDGIRTARPRPMDRSKAVK